ncbi:MAG: hypothetical protein ACT4OM_11340 [Actinomycetota bacterium]
MNFFDKRVKLAEDQTEKLIGDYAKAMSAHQDTSTLKTMVGAGAPATSIADRAAAIHQMLFKELLAEGAGLKVLQHPRRVKIIEKFCLALWGRMIGNEPYQALLAKFK